MDWNDDPAPTRPRAEVLAAVVKRGEWLRRRRRGAMAGGLAALLLAAAAPVVMLTTGDNTSGTTVRASGHGVTTTSSAAAAPTSTPPSDIGAVLVPPPTNPAPGGATVSPSVTDGPSDTSPPVDVTEPPTQAPVTAPSAPPPCTPDRLAVTVTTDKPTYHPGEKVTATSTVRNTGPEACGYYSYSAVAAIDDAAGNELASGPVVHADAPMGASLAAGGTETHTATWDLCPGDQNCIPLGAGTYSILVRWTFGSPDAAARVYFSVV